jgi:membrane fusion protein (multidrug efflux system)
MVAEAVDVPVRLPAVGSLRSRETTTVAADSSGLLVYLDIPEGKRVEKGHVLARLDDEQARARLQVAEARYRNAQAEIERLRPLLDQGVISRSALDAAEAELETAEGLVEDARSARGKTTVRAPFTGVLGLQTAQPGQYLSSGDPIVQITKVDPLELIFSLPEDQAGLVEVGQTALGMVGGCGPRFEARVEAIDPVVDPATRTLSLQAVVPNPDGILRPGMSVRVRLIVGIEEDQVVIPHEALVRQGTRYLVWLVGEDDTANPGAVRVGAFLSDGVQILQGVGIGDEVVVAGHQKLRPGQPVQTLPWQPTENPLLELGSAGGEECIF